MESKIFLSSNGYDFLESYATALYKERGAFRHNLERYMFSSEFISAYRNPMTVDDIPEITFEDIKNQVKRDVHFNNLCNHVMEVYAQCEQNDELTDDDYYEIAGIMGLCPGQCDWHETLFPHLIDLFVSSEQEGKEIWECAKLALRCIPRSHSTTLWSPNKWNRYNKRFKNCAVFCMLRI